MSDMVYCKKEVRTKINNHNSLAKRLYSQRFMQLFALAGVAYMLIFNYLPMYGMIIAFKDYRISSTIMGAPWVGFEYFKEFLLDERFGLILRNTLGISLLNLFIGFPLAILLALFLNELLNLRFKKVVQTISYLPHFLSWAVLGGMIVSFLSSTGFVNTVLISLGILKEPIIFLAESDYFWLIVVSTAVWKELGWSTILYLAAIASVDPQLYESAIIDGAGRFKRMWYITIPSIKFTISILFVLSVSHLLNSNFEQIFVLSNPMNRSASDVIDIFVYRMGIGSAKYSFATAAGLLKSIVALFLLIMANKLTKKIADSSFF